MPENRNARERLTARTRLGTELCVLCRQSFREPPRPPDRRRELACGAGSLHLLDALFDSGHLPLSGHSRSHRLRSGRVEPMFAPVGTQPFPSPHDLVDLIELQATAAQKKQHLARIGWQARPRRCNQVVRRTPRDRRLRRNLPCRQTRPLQNEAQYGQELENRRRSQFLAPQSHPLRRTEGLWLPLSDDSQISAQLEPAERHRSTPPQQLTIHRQAHISPAGSTLWRRPRSCIRSTKIMPGATTSTVMPIDKRAAMRTGTYTLSDKDDPNPTNTAIIQMVARRAVKLGGSPATTAHGRYCLMGIISSPGGAAPGARGHGPVGEVGDIGSHVRSEVALDGERSLRGRHRTGRNDSILSPEFGTTHVSGELCVQARRSVQRGVHGSKR